MGLIGLTYLMDLSLIDSTLGIILIIVGALSLVVALLSHTLLPVSLDFSITAYPDIYE
jgi:hypothetical protein